MFKVVWTLTCKRGLIPAGFASRIVFGKPQSVAVSAVAAVVSGFTLSCFGFKLDQCCYLCALIILRGTFWCAEMRDPRKSGSVRGGEW